MNTREIRARASLERRALTDAEKEAGYIGVLRGTIPFNADSELLSSRRHPRPFVERLAPDVFKRSLAEDKDIMVTAGHSEDPQASLARIGENLTITADARGLTYEALLPDTTAARDIFQLVEKRVLRGTSFEFVVRGEDGQSWEKRDARSDTRVIKDARLHSFNPVIWPAYKDAELTVELRSAQRELAEMRGAYAASGGDGIIDYYDPTITADTKFAASALDRASYALRDALEYLRASPAGGMADFARAEVAAAADRLKAAADWLAANGDQVNEAVMKRARDLETEARSALVPAAPVFDERAYWERRLRLPAA